MIRVCEFYKFVEYSKNKRVIAIGAGRVFRRLVKDYNIPFFYAIDNNMACGTIISYGGREIPVYDWDYLLHNACSDNILLITPRQYEELLEMIQSSEELKEIDCYIYSYFNKLKYDEDRLQFQVNPIVYKQKTEKKIPKIIHYFWFSGEEYPEKIKRCIDSWHKYCPDFEIKKWDLDNYDYKTNIFSREAIEHRAWAFASDVARADVVYRYGGIYLDSDVEIVRSLEDLLYHDAFIGFEDNNAVDPGSGFGAVPGNKIIQAFCNMYKDKHFILEDGSINNLACPKYYTDELVKRGLKLSGSFQIVDGMAVYPVTYFCPHSYRSGLTYRRPETYSIHHHTASWKNEEEKKEIQDARAIFKKFYNGEGVMEDW